MERVFLGIGSNVDPERHVAIAVHCLDDAFAGLDLSPVYRSRAVGFEGADFINLVASVETALSPRALRDWLRALEDAHGRDRGGPKFADRVLDVDIILYGDRVQADPDLPLPRPELFRFAHVLRPLAELAPTLACPGDGRPFRQLRAELALDESGLTLMEDLSFLDRP